MVSGITALRIWSVLLCHIYPESLMQVKPFFSLVGIAVGASVGVAVGVAVGVDVGVSVGMPVGAAVGAFVDLHS